MIISVTVTNHLDESLTLDLRSPEDSGFAVQDIAGLGPSKGDINATEISSGDGSVFNSARINSRNIVLTLKLLELPTIELVRLKSYRYFPIKKRLKLSIETDTRSFEIYGYVEANEPNIFSNNETIQISIICPDPYFYSTYIQSTVLGGIQPAFEFPFSNESLIDPLIDFGEIVTDHEHSIVYPGDSEIGVTIYVHSHGEVTNLCIHNTTLDEELKIDTDKLVALTGSPIIDGDDVIISTVKGNKYLQLIRDGEYINILNTLTKDSDWLTLQYGTNIFAFIADSGDQYLSFRVDNQILYEGV